MDSSNNTSVYPRPERIVLDLASYTIEVHFVNQSSPLTVHFDKPARRFYCALIAFIIIEMKKNQRPDFVYIRKHEKTLKMLDDSLAGKNASNSVKGMWDKIRKAWRYTLPDLESGSLFKVLHRSTISPSEKGGKFRYECTEVEGDSWANLFGYDENNSWRFKFAIDTLPLSLEDIQVRAGDLRDGAAWEDFIANLTTSDLLQPSSSHSVLPKQIQPALLTMKSRVALSIFVVVLSISGILFSWKITKHNGIPTAETALQDKLSIAILPFENLSGEQNQEYFCDGFTEDLITDLSKIPDLFVIARNSSFTYKGQAVKVQQIAQELGVKYILEGSIRKVNDQIRINAQLIDGDTGHHLWAKKFDRDFENIFALQDGISKEILTALKVQLTYGEQVRIFSENTDNLQAYLAYLQAMHHLRKTNREGTELARYFSQQAISLDPDYADPYRVLAWAHVWDLWFGWSESPQESFQLAEKMTEKALHLDNDNPNTTALQGHLCLLKRQHDKAIMLGEKSINLDPNSANNYMILAGTLRFSGRAAEGIPLLLKAIRLEPHTPANYYYQLGMAYNFTGNYDRAISAFKSGQNRTPDHLLSQLGLTIAYSLAGRMEEARASADELLKMNPNLSIDDLEKKAPYRNKADLELSMGALRKAGLR